MSSIDDKINNLSPEKKALLALLLKKKTDQGQDIEQAGRRDTVIRKAPRLPALPLSFAQQRLWFIAQLEPGNIAYNMPESYRFTGPLDLQTLRRAYSEMIRRHEVLRTTFRELDEKPAQVISSTLSDFFTLVDLTELSERAREEEALKLAAFETAIPFDLRIGPLLRVTTIKLNDEDHVLLQTTHHIISDGWSMRIMADELTVLYKAFSNSEDCPISELAIQYGDYAYWQRQNLSDEALARQVAYWKKQLAQLPRAVNLPMDRPRPAVSTSRGAHETMEVPAETAQRLMQLSRQEDATLFMTMLAAFNLLLFKYAAQSDIPIGVMIANRNSPELERLIGLFLNTVVIRTDLSGNPTFRELLRRVRAQSLEAYANQDVPFEKLVEVLRPERDRARAPLFQIVFDLQTAPAPVAEASRLKRSHFGRGSSATKFDLTFFMTYTGTSIVGLMDYNADLFDSATIQLMLKKFNTLLSYVAAQPDARLSAIEVEGRDDRERKHMEIKSRHKASFDKFIKKKPEAVALSQTQMVEAESINPGEALPLVLKPSLAEVDLVDWTRRSLTFLEDKLLKHGALLFRGFKLDSLAQFEEFAALITPDLFNENGEHPRDSVSGNIYTPVFYPPEQFLLWHNENSFNRHWPSKIWFHCGKAADTGGETPIVDSRKVFNLIDPEIRDRFMKKNIIYMRNFGEGLGLDWRAVFQTDEREKVEEICRANGIEFEWKGKDRLSTRALRLAVVRHPKTGEYVWFNQATHWHMSCLDPATRDSLLSIFDPEDVPRNCFYGDGTQIEDSAMNHICEVYRKAEVCFPWQQGDILMLDNMLTAHARRPFSGTRKIYVIMGQMISASEIEDSL